MSRKERKDANAVRTLRSRWSSSRKKKRARKWLLERLS